MNGSNSILFTSPIVRNECGCVVRSHKRMTIINVFKQLNGSDLNNYNVYQKISKESGISVCTITDTSRSTL